MAVHFTSGETGSSPSAFGEREDKAQGLVVSAGT